MAETAGKEAGPQRRRDAGPGGAGVRPTGGDTGKIGLIVRASSARLGGTAGGALHLALHLLVALLSLGLFIVHTADDSGQAAGTAIFENVGDDVILLQGGHAERKVDVT